MHRLACHEQKRRASLGLRKWRETWKRDWKKGKWSNLVKGRQSGCVVYQEWLVLNCNKLIVHLD